MLTSRVGARSHRRERIWGGFDFVGLDYPTQYLLKVLPFTCKFQDFVFSFLAPKNKFKLLFLLLIPWNFKKHVKVLTLHGTFLIKHKYAHKSNFWVNLWPGDYYFSDSVPQNSLTFINFDWFLKPQVHMVITSIKGLLYITMYKHT